LQGGSKIDTMKDLFNRHFGQNWILTGSDAIQKYLDHFKITDFKIRVNDVDILFVNNNSPNITETRFEEYVSTQRTPERSKTFSYGASSFDVTLVPNSFSYYEIDGIKLATPEHMLDNYIDNIDRGHPDDRTKISALERIRTLLNPDNKQKIELSRKRRGHPSDENENLDISHLSHLDPNRLKFTGIAFDPSDSGPIKIEDLVPSSSTLNFGSPKQENSSSGALKFDSPKRESGASGALKFDSPKRESGASGALSFGSPKRESGASGALKIEDL
jgi:hypothetical protein